MEIRDTRNGDWHWVYNAVLADPHLTTAEKLVYAAISTFGGHQTIHPTLIQIGERCGVDERTARRSLRTLEEVGYLKTDLSTGRGNANVYYLLKSPKGCLKCPLLEKGGHSGMERGTITTLKGATVPPHIDKKDKEKDIEEVSENTPKKERSNLEGFGEFTRLYPKKQDIARASAVWRKLSETDRDLALSDLKSRAWGEPKYIPLPKNYLEGKRWEDELTNKTDTYVV